MLLEWLENLCSKDEVIGGIDNFDLGVWLNSKDKGAVNCLKLSGLKIKVETIERYKKYCKVELKACKEHQPGF